MISLNNKTLLETGQLAPRFEYISKLREERERSSPTRASAHTDDGSSTHVCLTGHLFDTSLINCALVGK